MMRRIDPITFTLAGSGIALPDAKIMSAVVDKHIGKPAGWTQSHFGIEARYWASGDETSSSLGAQAAQAALDNAGWMASDLDVIIAACGVMEQPIPGTAPLIQRRLGIGGSGITAFDVNATCLSFLVAFETMVSGMAIGRWRRGLIVSADIASAALNFTAAEASVIFGDGAAAITVEADGPSQWLASRVNTYGDSADLCRLEAGGTRLRPHDDIDNFLAKSRFIMDGPGVFKATARQFPAFLAQIVENAGLTAGDLDSVIPHQASAPALEHLKRAVPGGHAKTIDIFRDYGNQIATSMPHALHHARMVGRTLAGSHSLLIGTSAGISLGGAVIKW